VAKGNLQDVLDRNGIPSATFFNSLRHHNDKKLQRQLHEINYEEAIGALHRDKGGVTDAIEVPELVEILDAQAEALAQKETCETMQDFVATEIEVSDEIFFRFGFEEQEITRSY
jgi:hypothetical protein